MKSHNSRRTITPYTPAHGIPTLLLLLILSPPHIPFVGAQQPSDSTSSDGYTLTTNNMAVIVFVLTIAFFITGSVSIYIQQCADQTSSSPIAGDGEVRSTGQLSSVDESLVESFPTFFYSAVKELKVGKGSSLECAICISEFEDDENLRLLPKCDHVFHTDCIDTWLSGHTTCPVCRANLVARDSAAELELSSSSSGDEIPGSDVRITIEDEEMTTTTTPKNESELCGSLGDQEVTVLPMQRRGSEVSEIALDWSLAESTRRGGLGEVHVEAAGGGSEAGVGSGEVEAFDEPNVGVASGIVFTAEWWRRRGELE